MSQTQAVNGEGSRSRPPANGVTNTKSGLIPTNSVTTKDGGTVRARIDPTLSVADVVKQLCINLKIKEPSSNFALRDEADELVTNDNLRKKIKAKANLKCRSVPYCLFSRANVCFILLPSLHLGLSMPLQLRQQKP